jgi:hypothetical protein
MINDRKFSDNFFDTSAHSYGAECRRRVQGFNGRGSAAGLLVIRAKVFT